MEIAAQFSLHFQMENVSPGKTKKMLNITNQFSSSFHQNDHTVSGHLMFVTNDLENVGQGQNLQKCYFFKLEYI